MPEYSSETQEQIDDLRALRAAGTPIEVYEIVRVSWGDDESDAVNYAVLKTDELASVPPPFDVDCRLVPGSMPDWFLPINVSSTIGDDEVTLRFQDFDDAITDLLIEHGEGCRAEMFYWYPQVELLLPVWHGHLRLEEQADGYFTPVKVEQGFRSAEGDLPRRQHYEYCQAVFGGLFETDEEAEEHGPDCDYDLNRGGSVGTNDPGTSQPWTFCNRLDTQSCIDRGVDPLRHLSHRSMNVTVYIRKARAYSTSAGNETNLTDPVRVIMGQRRCYDFKVLNYRRDPSTNSNPDRGWFKANYEVSEGPIAAISQVKIADQVAIAMHYSYRLGQRGQSAINDLTTHGYSGTAIIGYNYGWVNPANIDPNSITSQALITGLSDIRIYAEDEENPGEYIYTEASTSNRVWQIMRMLADKRWGVGYAYADFEISTWVETAEWAATRVKYTDIDGEEWVHYRSESNVDLVGKKLQTQIEDICRAGNLSLPFIFNGKIHIVPLRALTEDELGECPEFTDEGDDRNIVWDGEGDGGSLSSLRVSRQSAIDLPNRIETTFADIENRHLETAGRPVEDVDAQLAAGRVQGRTQRRVVSKSFDLAGVTFKAQQVKMSWSLLDRGEFDKGGLQNNCRVKFKVWFMDALTLHPHKVIKVTNARLQAKYGFQYFRILPDGLRRDGNLFYEVEAQAYNVDYMDAFEVDFPTGGGTGDVCTIDDECDIGWICVRGRCVPDIGPPPCRPAFGTVSYEDGMLQIPIDPC